jgi:hypothetical protein
MNPTNCFQSTTAYHPSATPPSATVSSREWPTLTIYRDGMTNLNALASALFDIGNVVGLVEPAPTKPNRLRKAWQLHRDPTKGGVPLFGRADRITLLRFRAAGAAQLLFAEVGPETERLSFVLTLEPSSPKHFRLLPI